MGIDGGGSTVRVLITDAANTVVGQAQGAGVNPSLLGKKLAAGELQATIQQALKIARLQPSDITGVGTGVAGADPDWCTSVIGRVLPGVPCVHAGDLEIALVGAHGQRQGIIVLAGTGSASFGINAAGETALAGAYGYLFDDVGSGYWLGKEAIRRSIRAIDGTSPPTRLQAAIFEALHLTERREVVRWMYATVAENASAVARLAPLVLDIAAAGDAVAQDIIRVGAQELYLLGTTVMQRLQMEREAIAFAGGLLTSTNCLSTRLCELFAFPSIPMPRHAPAVGAALLARSHVEPL